MMPSTGNLRKMEHHSLERAQALEQMMALSTWDNQAEIYHALESNSVLIGKGRKNSAGLLPASYKLDILKQAAYPMV